MVNGMKEIAALIFASVLGLVPVQANEGCKELGEFAQLVMEHRQNEVPISTLMANLASIEGSELWRAIVIEAYKQRSFLSPENKDRAINEFRNEIELLCYTSQ